MALLGVPASPPPIVSSAGRRFAASAALAVALTGGAARASAQGAARTDASALEYEVKAAYLLNFTRYVEWPPSVFPAEDAPLVICVIGRDPFRTILERTIEGQVTDGHLLRIQHASSMTESRGCHVAFISPPPGEQTVPVFGGATPPVLTIGEGADFAREGGMIGLVIVNSTVRFDVNLGAVRRAGLRLSSRVLALAAHVYEKGAEE